MPHLNLDLPDDVDAKLALYQALYAIEPREVVTVLARFHHVTTEPLSAQDVTWLVKHSKLRQFYAHGLDQEAS